MYTHLHVTHVRLHAIASTRTHSLMFTHSYMHALRRTDAYTHLDAFTRKYAKLRTLAHIYTHLDAFSRKRTWAHIYKR